MYNERMKFPPCHRLLRRPVKTLTGSLLLVLACRLVWIAARSETSSTILADHVYQATRGAVDLRRTSVFELSAIEQADYWISELDRIVEAEPDRADLAIGAAWCLCAFRQRFPLRVEASQSDLLPFVDRSSHSWGSDRAFEIFAARCWRKCAELAERATRLQPDDVRWWRARSLLDTTRSSNWREALNKASRHDPENALYDYLAAAHLWNQSYREVHDERGDSYEMAVGQLIEEGRACFDAGQAKAFLAYGIAGLPSIAEVLDRSTLSADDKVVLSAIHELPRYAYPLSDLMHLQNERAELAKRSGDQVAAIALHRQNMHLLSQAVSAGEPIGSRYTLVMTIDRLAGGQRFS